MDRGSITHLALLHPPLPMPPRYYHIWTFGHAAGRGIVGSISLSSSSDVRIARASHSGHRDWPLAGRVVGCGLRASPRQKSFSIQLLATLGRPARDSSRCTTNIYKGFDRVRRVVQNTIVGTTGRSASLANVFALFAESQIQVGSLYRKFPKR